MTNGGVEQQAPEAPGRVQGAAAALLGRQRPARVVVVAGPSVPARQLLEQLRAVAGAASYPHYAAGHGVPPLTRLFHLDGAVDEAFQLHHVRPTVPILVEVRHLRAPQIDRAGRGPGQG